jgi:alpha 1,3-mannosyltransferase
MGVVQDPDEFNPAKDLPATSPELDLATTKKKEGKLASGHETDLTICAPQLLHLGRDNRPMWFNGWLYKNKYAGPERMIGQFDVFMEEPTEKVNLEAWKLGESNMGCLSNTATREFTQEETEWLGQLIKMARMEENLAVG